MPFNNVNNKIWYFSKSKSSYLLCVLLTFTFLHVTSPSYSIQNILYNSVDQVPNPKTNGSGYISDPQSLIAPSEADSLNRLLAILDNKLGVEAAVVITNNFDEQADDFKFATELFRKWGIGKRQANNGLLLFIATNTRQYRFITGYGLEGLLPDEKLSKIGSRTLIPAFKAENYGEGVLRTMEVISAYLQQPANKKELDMLLQKQSVNDEAVSTKLISFFTILLLTIAAGLQISKIKGKVPKNRNHTVNLYSDITIWLAVSITILILLFLLIVLVTGHIGDLFKGLTGSILTTGIIVCMLYIFFAHLGVLNKMRRGYVDEVNFIQQSKAFYRKAWWHVLLSPLSLIWLLVQYYKSTQIGKRLQPLMDDNGQPMQRLNRDAEKKASIHLSAGQLKEEELGSMVYDIWWQKDTKTVNVVPYHGYCYKDFEPCPNCNFRTFTKPLEITEQKATYTRTGKAKRVRICRNCSYEHFIEYITLPMLVKSSSSASSSSSGRSSSSSSSGSSWGGGSTGGGGAGGSW
ncbi:TPM domain-containing protein [uncultured Mucilaginibacter sp.]|uniref:TPM domain-containing protein n=1 Tax=uncultured Mucilaginibacter sp. TaxID=797541 RepID=UPI0025D15110|nr:TPM domain-containing protein [uncultured Mucilaginibacter sp.]